MDCASSFLSWERNNLAVVVYVQKKFLFCLTIYFSWIVYVSVPRLLVYSVRRDMIKITSTYEYDYSKFILLRNSLSKKNKKSPCFEYPETYHDYNTMDNQSLSYTDQLTSVVMSMR
ncbi:hypothetical protein BDC45DRAFT_534871 [Circinella umbellata]|nr:hypothetical protein BDC45DRAFT_534871 [Circinella umbellata]